MAKQLKVGIDLGTARTAVQTDRGVKTVFPSVVGYPKDIISAKLLNKPRAIGNEALEKRSYLDIYYPLELGVIKETNEGDLEAARDLLHYAISAAAPEEGDEICAVIGVPAKVAFSNKEQMLRLANEVTAVTLVVSEPFMVGYGLDKLTRTIIIDIGAGTTDISILRGTVPDAEDQSTISKGGDHIDEVLIAQLLEHYPGVQVTKQMAQAIKEKYAFVGDPQEAALYTFRVNGKPSEFDVTQEIKSACGTLVSPIVEQVESLLVRFDPEDQGEALKNIYLAGNGSRIRGMDKAIENALEEYGEIKVTCVQDPDFAGSSGALKIAEELPIEQWDQIGDVIGL
ncbi:MAG: rod shape-determining protein [SAR324 cluster bacterium]|nr:rod shape-determining protein [SAR324 cluster bacterium]